MEKTMKTTKLTTSWIVLSWAAVNWAYPILLAGTWKQYSAKAISQLTRMTRGSGALRYLRWPYQAMVMKMLEMVSSTTVVMGPPGVSHRVRPPHGKPPRPADSTIFQLASPISLTPRRAIAIA